MRHSFAIVIALAAALCLTGCSDYQGPIGPNQGCYGGGGPSSMGRFLGGPDNNC
jgi:hypothetical protein